MNILPSGPTSSPLSIRIPFEFNLSQFFQKLDLQAKSNLKNIFRRHLYGFIPITIYNLLSYLI
jgi:hypothetical protein